MKRRTVSRKVSCSASKISLCMAADGTTGTRSAQRRKGILIFTNERTPQGGDPGAARSGGARRAEEGAQGRRDDRALAAQPDRARRAQGGRRAAPGSRADGAVLDLAR